jgi:exodeoxyribonuclease VII large subunit
MSQLPLFQPLSWSVTELTAHIRQLLEGDYQLQDVWVEGEVSNCQRAGSGHLYFTLKDRTASIRCVMWRNQVMRQSFTPRDGDAIEVHGAIGVYEAAGQYQFYADLIRPTGEGRLYKEFLRLKARLEAEGLFDIDRKRPLPRWPQCIGIVTSPTGAAVRDILNTIRRRCPSALIVLSPTPVQGEEAPFGIMQALKDLERLVAPDVILLARGGGSIEDLWAFNDEGVARAIAACRAPVVSGIGHETDFTISDFVADVRAPTPTAAAEVATPDQAELRGELEELYQHLKLTARSALTQPRLELNQLTRRLDLQSPEAWVRSDRQRLDDNTHRMNTALEHSLDLHAAHLDGIRQRLAALDPKSVLSRGFSIVTTRTGMVVSQLHQVQPGDSIRIQVSDGEFGARVDEAEDGGGTQL